MLRNQTETGLSLQWTGYLWNVVVACMVMFGLWEMWFVWRCLVCERCVCVRIFGLWEMYGLCEDVWFVRVLVCVRMFGLWEMCLCLCEDVWFMRDVSVFVWGCLVCERCGLCEDVWFVRDVNHQLTYSCTSDNTFAAFCHHSSRPSSHPSLASVPRNAPTNNHQATRNLHLCCKTIPGVFMLVFDKVILVFHLQCLNVQLVCSCASSCNDLQCGLFQSLELLFFSEVSMIEGLPCGMKSPTKTFPIHTISEYSDRFPNYK